MASRKQGSLDTNLLLRLVLGDIPMQTKAVETLLASGVFDVSDIAIVEMVFVLEKIYRLPRPLVAENIAIIIRHPSINSNRKLFALTLPLYIAQPKLSIVDCTLLMYAELNKAAPLYTFDADLAKICSPIAKQL